VIDELLKAVITNLKINKFVETGTLDGETVALVARWFAGESNDFGTIEKLTLNPIDTTIAYPIFSATNKNSRYKMYSVDINSQKAAHAKEVFASNPNITVECGNSPAFLKHLIESKSISTVDNTMFFLDAHWNRYWPLRDEIKEILRLPSFAIVVDDFVVPGHPDFGCDSYGWDVCSWDYIKGLFRGRNVVKLYPVRSNRDDRGWVLILSGFDKKGIAKLPIFHHNLFDHLRHYSLTSFILQQLSNLKTKYGKPINKQEGR
jgi:hypothetical protein